MSRSWAISSTSSRTSARNARSSPVDRHPGEPVAARPPHLTQVQLVQALGSPTRFCTPAGAVEHLHPIRSDTAWVETRRREQAVEQRGVLIGSAQHQHLFPALHRISEPGAEHGIMLGPTREHHDRVHSALPGAPSAPRRPAPPPPVYDRGRSRYANTVDNVRKATARANRARRPRPWAEAGTVAVQSPSIRRHGARRRSSAPGSPAGGTPIPRASAGRMGPCSRPRW